MTFCIIIMIRQNFMEKEAHQILKILIPRTPNPDQPLCHFEKQGEYIAKSGHYVTLKLNFVDQPSSSDSK